MKQSFLKMSMIALIGLFACNNSKKEYDFKINVQDQIEEGKKLVITHGCHDCHSPKIMTDRGPMPDPDKLLSGHNSKEMLAPYDLETAKMYVLFNMNNTAAVGPWGTSFSANLTPDETGIGTWSEEQFLKAMKHGKYKGLENGRQLLPPMPWQGYSQMPDKDINAIFAYLKTIKPVDNLVPQMIPPVL